MSFYGYKSYVSVSEIREKAAKKLEKLRKKNPEIAPVTITGTAIAKSWWGKAWNKNLESYADFSNRIGRGKSYVRNGAVLDLRIKQGMVEALVQGSRVKPYEVDIHIDTLTEDKWEKITKLCNNQIASLSALTGGKFPKELEALFVDPGYGLFPSPRQIHFDCSCPDYAYMCKHVASVLYGIGARLDENPLLFFELRGVDYDQLVRRSIDAKLSNMLKNAGKKSGRELEENTAAELFHCKF